MKRLCLMIGLTAALFLPTNCGAQDITTNILLRVFKLQYGEKWGTSFTIEVDNRQYLITAKHVVDGIEDGDSVNLYLQDGWRSFEVKPIYCQPRSVDIVALALPEVISPTFELNATSTNILLAQDVYFLGFPFGLGSVMEGLAPIPFVKKGILSSITFNDARGSILFVDGHNNPGFSGGPVVFVHSKTKRLRVAGVVKGYREQIDRVLGETVEGGSRLEGLYVRANSGILVAYNIKHVVEAIRERPVGAPVTE